MREVASAICGTLSNDGLCIRSGNREYLVALQSSIGQANDMIEAARAMAAKRIRKSQSRFEGLGISVALLPVANVVELSPSEILDLAVERTHSALECLVNEVVVLAPLSTSQLRSDGNLNVRR